MRPSKNTREPRIANSSGKILFLSLYLLVLIQCSKVFASENLIHVPARGSRTAVWTKPDECVWKAPDFLTEWHSLSDLEGFRGNEKLTRLFTSVLNIEDADWTDYLNQLQVHKEKGLAHDRIEDIYRCLYQEVIGDAAWEIVR